LGIQTDHTNRSARFEVLFADKSLFTYEDFKTIKYDKQYPDSVIFILDFERFRNIDTEKYPDLKQIVTELKNWDLRGDKDSKAGAYFAVAFPFVLEKLGNFYLGEEQNADFSDDDVAELMRKTQKHIMKHFKTMDVTLGQVQRLRRGDIDLPLAGLPDVITAMYSSPRKKDGTLAPWSGESYIMMVKMGKNGPEIETINAFGASNKKDSPHYTDQMEMFTNEKLKPMTLDKKIIFENAVKVYSPN
jgi:acyl-homoserine-lactone acylase